MNPAEEPRETYWDLLADVARLQSEMGKDLVAWSKAYEAGGRAFQRTSQTLTLMAEIGRRMERFVQSGPPRAVQQALQVVANPWQAMGAVPGASAGDPFTRFWEFWAPAGSTRERPPRPGSGESESEA